MRSLQDLIDALDRAEANVTALQTCIYLSVKERDAIIELERWRCRFAEAEWFARCNKLGIWAEQ
jgi:hypothetical protein